MTFTSDLQIKTLEAKVAVLTQDFARLAGVVESRTQDLRRAHNALVQTLKGELPKVDEPAPDTACAGCGHGPEAVVSGDEGTSYCGECEADAKAVSEPLAEQSDKPTKDSLE